MDVAAFRKRENSSSKALFTVLIRQKSASYNLLLIIDMLLIFTLSNILFPHHEAEHGCAEFDLPPSLQLFLYLKLWSFT